MEELQASLSHRSQVFHRRLFFSNQAKLRSTTQRLGITAVLCNPLRLAICTVPLRPAFPAPLEQKATPRNRCQPARLYFTEAAFSTLQACNAPLRSVTSAAVTQWHGAAPAYSR